MNSLLLSSPLFIKLHPSYSPTSHPLHPLRISTGGHNITRSRCMPFLQLSAPKKKHFTLLTNHFCTEATFPSSEGSISVIDFQELVEKDWSFIDLDELNSNEDHIEHIGRIISAGGIQENSRVLVSIGSEKFVDHLVKTSSYNFLLVVHDSLFQLAVIKEKYDEVKCWQGELISVPEKWAPLDVVFLYFLPALSFSLDQVFAALAKRCSPGARVVISHPLGKEVLEQQKKQYPDAVIADLPDRVTLQKVAENHSFQMTEYADEPGIFLAVLQFCEVKNFQ
ncbi:hypothetical protein K2173_024128 [Erythroxylum novogranatense]|uniref:Uncharacterized protein n=1 Tax=Erythroxylum novogranatense TaxID=1862640 RepID=A0AAV8UC02_9ROSI|nr:hypothetical protein K2173_024128 [Erythroxylum novogranatense]